MEKSHRSAEGNFSVYLFVAVLSVCVRYFYSVVVTYATESFTQHTCDSICLCVVI